MRQGFLEESLPEASWHAGQTELVMDEFVDGADARPAESLLTNPRVLAQHEVGDPCGRLHSHGERHGTDRPATDGDVLQECGSALTLIKTPQISRTSRRKSDRMA